MATARPVVDKRKLTGLCREINKVFANCEEYARALPPGKLPKYDLRVVTVERFVKESGGRVQGRLHALVTGSVDKAYKAKNHLEAKVLREWKSFEDWRAKFSASFEE
jgi:hypothetical protein